MDISHGEKRVEMPNEDGTTTIFTNGYLDGPRTIKEQIRHDIDTTPGHLLRDVIACLEALKSNTPDLNIYIKKDKQGNVRLIQKTWTIKKERVR